MKVIRLDGEIGAWWNSGEFFGERLRELALEVGEELMVIINSMGGSVVDGFSIYNQIKALENPTITKIEGFACSIAALIAMSGDTIQMSEVGQLMIHRARLGLQGDKNELEKQAEILNSIDETQIKVFSAKTGLTKKAVEAMLDSETWFNSSEAKTEKFIDVIVDKMEAGTKYQYAANTNLNNQNSEIMKNVFKAILDKMSSGVTPPAIKPKAETTPPATTPPATTEPPPVKSENVSREEFDQLNANLTALITALADKEAATDTPPPATNTPPATDTPPPAGVLTDEQILALGLNPEQIAALAAMTETPPAVTTPPATIPPVLTEEQQIEALATQKFNALIAGLPGSKGTPPAGKTSFSQKPQYVDMWQKQREQQKEIEAKTRLS